MRRIRASFSVPAALAALIWSAPMLYAAAPELVSPGHVFGASRILGRCPTFSWGLVDGAESLELVVYRLHSDQPRQDPLGLSLIDEASEPGGLGSVPTIHHLLSGSAQSWTPSVDACLEAGGSYAWALRAETESGVGEWSEARLFEVASGPAIEEVEQALAVLRHYTEPSSSEESPRLELVGHEAGQEALRSASLPGVEVRPRGAEEPQSAAPTKGAASLALDDQLHLSTATDIYKDDFLFSWSETAAHIVTLGELALVNNTSGIDNTAVGNSALAFNTEGSDNTAVGENALRENQTGTTNTAIGAEAMRANKTGDSNTAVGNTALFVSTTGSKNTALGDDALLNNTTGNNNTAVGENALLGNTTGDDNVAIGRQAGQFTTGDNNVLIGSQGNAADNNTLRIAGLSASLDRAFIDGIRGASGTFDQEVCVDSGDQLGPCSPSSARFKEDVERMGNASSGVHALRPVRFRYTKEFAGEDEIRPVQFGLIAEEVAALYPELVTYDEEGRPETVRYQALTPLLLNELQKQRIELSRLAVLGTEVSRLLRLVTGGQDLVGVGARPSGR